MSVEPFEPGFYEYELELLDFLSYKIEKIEENVNENKDSKDSKDLIILPDLMKILRKCYKDQEKIFLEKFGNDPRHLQYLKARVPKLVTPSKFDSTLVEFFQSLDMGNGPSNVRFQEEPQCEVFFKEGFCRLTTLVSLFNIFANNYKLKNKTEEVKLTPEQRTIIASALESMIVKYKKDNKLEDSKALEEGIILNRHYMIILAFYKDKTFITDKSYDEEVNTMSKLTKETNETLCSKLKDIQHT